MRIRSVVAAIAVIFTVLIAGQGQALAADFEKPFEDQMSTLSYESAGESCSEVFVWNPKSLSYDRTAKGCFSRYGDKWSIQDSLAEGNQTFIYWENWLRDANGGWQPYRHGWCNNNLGAPNWGACNKDYYESSSTNYYKGQGSRVRFQTCRRDLLNTSCTPSDISDAPWINNNA
ncbi:hypothetical protein ABZ070_25915 [Streptomyces sp. NPDC006283]|uniref:hypothetical protein n=1 Tax=Streptomyces sp. NPDC006283 TaxID=3156741 RepID=UPI00339F780A